MIKLNNEKYIQSMTEVMKYYGVTSYAINKLFEGKNNVFDHFFFSIFRLFSLFSEL